MKNHEPPDRTWNRRRGPCRIKSIHGGRKNVFSHSPETPVRKIWGWSFRCTSAFRVKLPTQVRPHVDSTSEPLPDGRFRYSYQIVNGSAAPDPITSWELEVASFNSTELLGVTGWLSKAMTETPGTENMYSYNKDHHAAWTVAPGTPGIATA